MIIIQHETGHPHQAFDVLLHKNSDRFDELKDDGYQISNCNFVEYFLKNNSDYVYVFSEDNAHIPEFNWINSFVEDEVKNGAKLVIITKENLKGDKE